MKTSFLRSAAAALLLGSAAIGAIAIVATPMQAEAAGVRPAVGNALKEAISLASSGHGSEALSKVHQAESVSGLTPSEQQAISQTKEYIAAKTGSGSGSAACRAKFANDYNAGRYHDVVGGDADCLHKAGSFSGNDQLIIAQAYYLMGSYQECIRAARAAGGSQANELVMSCAFKSGDSATMRGVLEDLISGGKTQYWSNYLTSVENSTKGLKDHQTLDIYRLRYKTGTMRNADDYMLAAELALQVNSPQEAVDIVQKGMDAKVLTGDRVVRLLNLAKANAAKDLPNLPAMEKAADAAKTGDADVKLGEELIGFGKGQDAVTAIQSGIRKGVDDKNNAQVRLGQAYLAAGQRDAAVSAFNKVDKNDAGWSTIGHIWALYARTGH
jgi:tetratricopeptide (TPR) repeat protein